MLGSGEERFCEQVLRSTPPSVESLGLVKEWKRAVTGLVLGEPGERRSVRQAFATTDLDKADRVLSLAFGSILEGYAAEIFPALSLPPALSGFFPRPLFGLESDGERVRWGGVDRDVLKGLGAGPILDPIRARGLDLVLLSV